MQVRRRPVAHTALLCSVLLLAHFASADDSPPLLRDVLSGRITGLAQEDEAIRSRVLKQARAFINYRRGSGMVKYLMSCADPGECENPFCLLEAELAAGKITALLEPKRIPGENPRSIAAEIVRGDLARLATYPASELSRGMSRIDDGASLVPLANRLVESGACANASLASALASKFEELFPEKTYIELNRRLYKFAAECGTDANSNLARFRFALVSIWQDRCAEAEPALTQLAQNPDASSFQARARYWRYHCAVLNKNEDVQKEMREALWRDHVLTFHNLAINGRDPRMTTVLADFSEPKIALRSVTRPELNLFLRGIEALIDAGSPSLAADMTDQIASRLSGTEPEVRLYVAALMNRAGYALPKFRVLSALFQNSPQFLSRSTLQLMFPKWYFDLIKPKEKQIDPLLVLSLIRQESAFNIKATSIVGARGLMQVMPATARSIAAVRRDKLFDPRTNIDVGTRYFLNRLGRYSGDVELTLAAYNAGFSRVDRWRQRYPIDNKLLFMDLIPFRETRDYVSSILRNYYWYTRLYGSHTVASAAAPAVMPSEEPLADAALAKVNAILNANAGFRGVRE